MKELSRATWIWWCILMMVMVMVMPSSSHSSSTIEEVGISKNLGYSTVQFEIYETDYSVFMTQLRNQLAASAKTCDIQTTPSNPAKGAEYVLVELIASDKQVTLGIDVKDGYVLGYQDKYNSKYRANMLKDVSASVSKTLFPEAATTKTFPFTGSYVDLERTSKSDRNTRELTFDGLYSDIQAVYGKDPDAKITSKFFLRAIQFVSEAARFKFIETAIKDQKITKDFRQKMIAYEQNWDSISQRVHTAASSTKCGAFSSPLTVNGQKLANVKDVKGDMGLLKHKKATAATGILADNAAPEFLESALLM